MEISDKTQITSVRQQLKSTNGNSCSGLGQAMFAWYQGLDDEKQTIVEQQITGLIDNYHQINRHQFGPVACLEVLGLLLLADPNCKLASDHWWMERRCHG